MAKKKERGPAAFAEALVAALTARNMNKAELADRIGKSPSAVGNWVAGRDTPSPETVFAIEEALGLAGGHLSRLLGFCPCNDGDPPTVEDALIADGRLQSEHKQALLGIYRGLIDSVR